MFSVKLTNTVNGIATSNVGARDTRATNHACSRNSATETAFKNERTASADIANVGSHRRTPDQSNPGDPGLGPGCHRQPVLPGSDCGHFMADLVGRGDS